MCRHEARDAYARIADMEAAGASRVVALVKEDLGTEVEEFRKFWQGDILLDVNTEFYKLLGGGSHHQPYSLASFLATIANPFSSARVKKNLSATKATGITQNMKGEGFIAGGVCVINRDGSVAYSFLEQELGDQAPIDSVISAVAEASKIE